MPERKASFSLPEEAAEKRKKQKAVFKRKKIQSSIRKKENDRRHKEFDKPFNFFEEK